MRAHRCAFALAAREGDGFDDRRVNLIRGAGSAPLLGKRHGCGRVPSWSATLRLQPPSTCTRHRSAGRVSGHEEARGAALHRQPAEALVRLPLTDDLDWHWCLRQMKRTPGRHAWRLFTRARPVNALLGRAQHSPRNQGMRPSRQADRPMVHKHPEPALDELPDEHVPTPSQLT
jgi:hypothetical protein